MAKIQAFSSVTVSDLTDAGQISLYITSNQPQSVIYDPNQNIYSPDWSQSNLVITPVVAYNGTQLSLTAPGLTVSFQRQEGSGTPVALTAGETVSGNKLTVSANKLASVTSKLLTYICNVTYTDPDSGIPLKTQSTLTYNLLSNATNTKDCSITGESVFLYDTNRNLVGNNTITLTAHLNNVSVSQWQYKKSDGSFTAFPTTNNESITGGSLKVFATEPNIWINDKNAVIKLVTSDSSVFDIHEIYKVYDGAAGTDTVSAILSNENHLVPVKSDGTVKSWTGAETSITIYEGGKDVTAQWTVTVKYGDGLTGTYDNTTHVMTPSKLTEDASYAEFTCTKSGKASIIKRYTITKQYAGNDGENAVIYEISPSVLAINLGKNGTFNPAQVVFTAYKKIGSALINSNFLGRFIIEESTDGNTFAPKYTSPTDEYSHTYRPSSNKIKAIKGSLYAAGGTTTLLDSQTVVITSDGTDGTNGKPGESAVSVIVTNSADVIPCDTSGKALVKKDIMIPFYGLLGTTRVPVTCTVGTLPSGVTIKTNTPGTAQAGGLLTLTVAAGANFGDAALMTGDITLTFVCQGISIEHKFTWTKSKQAANGQNAVLFQLFSPDGGVIVNGEGSTTINTMMVSGSTTVTPTAFEWSQFVDGKYTIIQGQTGNSLVVTADMVSSTSWFKCTATYSGKKYDAYWTVMDRSDPVMAYTYSTVTQFENGKGEGAVYTRVYRNGEELDPIKSLVFSTTAPSGASSGDYYYHLDRSKKLCILKKYNGTTWVDATEKDELTYEYYRINSKGVELDTTAPYKTGKCFYIDPSIIQGNMQFRCKTTLP